MIKFLRKLKLADKATYYKDRHDHLESLLRVRDEELNAVMRERDMYRDREQNLRDRIYSNETRANAAEAERDTLKNKYEEVKDQLDKMSQKQYDDAIIETCVGAIDEK